MTERKTERIDWRVTPSLKRQMEEYAAALSMSVADFLKLAVLAFVAKPPGEDDDQRPALERARPPVEAVKPKRRTVGDVLEARGGHSIGAVADTAPPSREHRLACKCGVCVAVHGKAGHP